VGETPSLSEANASHAIEAMEKIDFLVVQDIFLTETAQLADVVLPAATFAEKEGSFTNTERRVQRDQRPLPPAARPKDWRIVTDIAQAMGADGFDYNFTEAEIMAGDRQRSPPATGASAMSDWSRRAAVAVSDD
jgi:predicted molibdopterin-dependent oxidoreductase YjgC